MAGSEWLTCDQFAGRVGERFEVADPAVSLELTEAVESSEPGGRGRDGQTRNQFSLTFRGPVDPLLPQHTYALSHPELGDLEIFLVPSDRDERGTVYAAVFA